MSGDCGCGCKGHGSCGTRRDVGPPSSRRGERVGYRFATAAALVRSARITPPEAQRMVNEWARYVRYRMLQGKTAESTARHLVRFESQRLARPARDPQRRSRSRKRSKRDASSGYDVVRYPSGKYFVTEASGQPDYNSRRVALRVAEESNADWARRGRPSLSQEMARFFAPASRDHKGRGSRKRKSKASEIRRRKQRPKSGYKYYNSAPARYPLHTARERREAGRR